MAHYSERYWTLLQLRALFSGTDGYQADHIVVYTDANTDYYCKFLKLLEDDDSEIGRNCHIWHGYTP